MRLEHNRDYVRETLCTLLTENFRVANASLTPEADLFTDLSLDSLDIVDLLSLLNQKFNVFLSPSDFEGCRKLAQFEVRLTQVLNEPARQTTEKSE